MIGFFSNFFSGRKARKAALEAAEKRALEQAERTRQETARINAARASLRPGRMSPPSRSYYGPSVSSPPPVQHHHSSDGFIPGLMVGALAAHALSSSPSRSEEPSRPEPSPSYDSGSSSYSDSSSSYSSSYDSGSSSSSYDSGSSW